MDKETFSRLTTTLQSIKNNLLLSEDIRRLLVLEDPSGSDATPSVETAKENIFLQPIVAIATDGIYDKSSFITITLKSSTILDQKASIRHAIDIVVMTNENNYVYAEDKIRNLELVRIIIDKIENKTYSLSGPLIFTGVVQSLTNDAVTGFIISFIADDGIVKKDVTD